MKVSNRPLVAILVVGLIIRLTFLLIGANIYYGSEEATHINGDSYSYTESFLNLWEKGIYSFDFENEGASYGRLPGYPFFFGIHYLLFGNHAYDAISFTQLILDVISILLIFSITLKLTKSEKQALLSALIYACYPFTIVWITVIGTEALGMFLTLLFFYLLIVKEESTYKPIILGLALTACFYVREYLGILIISGFLFFILKHPFKLALKNIMVFGSVFFAFYILWPIRNYNNSGEIIFIKKDTGYERYASDVNSARAWMYVWTDYPDPYLDQIAQETSEIKFPKEIFASSQNKILVDSLIELCRTCGTGFYNWRTFGRYPKEKTNCNEQIESGFNSLKSNYRSAFPISYYFSVPFKNLKKSLFKTSLTSKDVTSFKSVVTSLLFTYRSIIHIIAFIGVFSFIYNKRSLPIAFFIFFIYIFICFWIRQLEMRYLLQADGALIVFSGVGIFCTFHCIKDKILLFKSSN